MATSAIRKPPKRGKVPCGVCQGPVVDGKDEALLCEGECGLWFHRGYASVPPLRYKMLSNSEEPFIRLSCTNLLLKQEIEQLKNELKSLAEVCSRCSTLANEVSSLRRALNTISKESQLLHQQPGQPSNSRNVPTQELLVLCELPVSYLLLMLRITVLPTPLKPVRYKQLVNQERVLCLVNER